MLTFKLGDLMPQLVFEKTEFVLRVIWYDQPYVTN